MNSKALTQVLTTHGQGKSEGDAIQFAEDSSVTLYASFGGESLSVGDVKRVQMQDDMVVAHTRKDETFVIASEDVWALRFSPKAEKKRTGLI